jgi:hypothetical protein
MYRCPRSYYFLLSLYLDSLELTEDLARRRLPPLVHGRELRSGLLESARLLGAAGLLCGLFVDVVLDPCAYDREAVIDRIGDLVGLIGGQGSGFRVQGSGFRVQGSGFRVHGLGIREKQLRFF